MSDLVKHLYETVKCKNCSSEFEARIADIKRGWGKFCSKSCKAKKQTQLTGVSSPHYKASGKTVNQMKNGKFTKTKFKKNSSLPTSVTHDEYGDWKKCGCGDNATIFVQNGFGNNGFSGQCEKCKDYTHPFDSDNFNNT